MRNVPFTDETKALEILESLKEYTGYELNGQSSKWCCKKIGDKLEKLCGLIEYDYCIESSMIVYHDYEIEWDLSVFILPLS